jgi:hypothetical protein
MQDIRPGLRERLDAIKVQRLKLDQEESSLKALLQLEEQRSLMNGDAALTLTNTPGSAAPDLRVLITGALRSQKRMTVTQIRETAERSFNFGSKAPGRVVHFTLQGMKKNGIVDQDADYWLLKEAVQ